jgi:hypothetical protein
MQAYDVAAARTKVLRDAARCVAEVRRITDCRIESVHDGIRVLAELRRAAYEDLNQIQHEFATARAVEWLHYSMRFHKDTAWSWNPRQTGGSDEPDVQGTFAGSVVVSGEVTSSPVAKGALDARMKKTLSKLSQMPGQKIYFVLSPQMAARARTKIQKQGHDIEVVELSTAGKI